MDCSLTQCAIYGEEYVVKTLACHDVTLPALNPAVRIVPGESDVEHVLAVVKKSGLSVERLALSVAQLAYLARTLPALLNDASSH
ncbi:uncharacterized protein RAG0_16657 [Rhynchosporium agropyri]|uniref:Uncharacterized protein n=2 Tax=Rhynchosporium TaxID=38037 RepID=A0A1E1MTN3_RHYSE|nr:uncharacterized protein RAG0_16657 [Rhynchosporium agropyri]CZT52444.1 uncharacterized protein RSE6_13779 [Rhynchosporium secalis]